MRRLLLVVLVVGLMIPVLNSTSVQARFVEGMMTTTAQGERVPGILVVNFKPNVLPEGSKRGGQRSGSLQAGAVIGIPSVDALGARWGLSEYRPLFPGAKLPAAPSSKPDLRGYQVLTFDASIDLDDAAAEYLADPSVESVEYDFYGNIMRTPSDQYYGQMYQLNAASDRDMDAPEAWDRTAGSPLVVLADTDTGVLYTHPDLINNIWVNPGEDLDGDGEVWDADDMNGVDDDNNGYTDDLIGYDFVVSGSSVWPGEDGAFKDNDPKDFHGHGTHTSGTMAATMNNGIGVASLAGGFGPSEPGCKIMCLRMGYSFNDGGSENGRTSMSYAAEAFHYAAKNGAVAINYSFGSSNGGGIGAAADYATAAGLVISASAGNSSNSSFGYLQSRSDVICVASTNSADQKSGFSNFGALVDVSAPGSSILSTVSNHYSAGYASWGGTSMAAPQVGGLVGLIRSLNPTLTRQEVTDRIINNADNIDAYNPSYVGLLGSGRINAFASLQGIAAAEFTASPRIGNAPLTVTFTDTSITTATGWKWYFGDGDSSTVQNPSHTYAPGLYDVALRIDSDIGEGMKTKLNYVAALAETLLTVDKEVLAGQPAFVEISLVNNLPLDTMILPIIASNIMSKGFLDSIVTTGCRTEHLTPQVVFDNRFVGQLAVRMATTDPDERLMPGDGPIAKVWFRTKSTAVPGDSIVITTGQLSSYDLRFTTGAIAFAPVFRSGALSIGFIVGDLDASESIDAVDLSMLIEIVFFGAALPVPEALADVNCSGFVDAVDISVMIEHVFFGGPAPCQ